MPIAYAMARKNRSSSNLRLEGENFSKRFGAALDEIIEVRRSMTFSLGHMGMSMRTLAPAPMAPR